MTPRASILIPAHNRAPSLALAVESALAQTVSDIEVLIVGDGVTDAVRTTARGLEADARVRFIDNPKGEHHGESYRHEAIGAALSDAIFYLCDDDLLLRDHVADLLALLETATFVQSLNGWVSPTGSIGIYPADLSDPACVAALVADDFRYNQVSITGTAHSKRQYELIGDPWSMTPDGEWPDQHQWRKFMRRDDFRGATSARMTALQFPATAEDRASWSAERALAELRAWADVVRTPDAQDRIDELVLRALRRQLEPATRVLAQEQHLRRRVEAELAHVYASKSWAASAPLRAIRRAFDRLR